MVLCKYQHIVFCCVCMLQRKKEKKIFRREKNHCNTQVICRIHMGFWNYFMQTTESLENYISFSQVILIIKYFLNISNKSSFFLFISYSFWLFHFLLLKSGITSIGKKFWSHKLRSSLCAEWIPHMTLKA